jgi:signal peptidase I
MASHLAERPGRPDYRRRLALRATVLVALVLVAATAVAWSAGVKPLVFTSGSMSPTISSGSLAFARTVDASDLEVGDVVSVASAHQERVTHRVEAVQHRDADTVLVLRGDANATTDPEPYVVTSAERVDLSVPGIGRAVAGLDGPVGVAVLVITGGAALVLLRSRSGSRHRQAGPRTGAPVAVLSLGAAVAVGAVVLGSAPTQAYWTDDATASSGTITTASPTPTPTGGACSDVGDHVLTSWTNVGQRYGYVVTLHRTDTGAQVGASIAVGASTAGSVASEIQRTAFGTAPSASGQVNFQLRVRAVPNGSTTWTSPTALAIPVSFQSGYTLLRCGNDTSTFVTISSLGVDSGTSSTDFVTNVAANTLTGTGESGSAIVIRRAGVQIATATVTSAGTWTSSTFTLTEGLQDLTATATDLAGNTATATRTGVWLDTVAPAVAITALGSDTGASTTDFITRTASNTLVGTGEVGATVVISRGGVQVATATVNASGQWTSSAFTLNEGLQDLTASSTDVAGNTASAVRSNVRLDTVAPVVTQAAPCAAANVGNAVSGFAGATWCKVTSLTWTATFADAGSGLVAGTGSQYANATSTFVNYTTAVAMGEANGRVMQARGTDVAGNVTTVSGTYYIDGTAPTMAITAPATSGLLRSAFLAGLSGSCGATSAGCGTIVDGVSGPASIEWRLQRTATGSNTQLQNTAGTWASGVMWLPGTVSAGAGTWSAVVPSPGVIYDAGLARTYTFSIRNATDAAGNVAAGPVSTSVLVLIGL